MDNTRGKAVKPATTGKRRAIFVFVHGQYHERQLAITGARITAYARRTQADLLFVRGNHHSDFVLLNRYRVAGYLNMYDRILALDTDIVIRRDAPDIFKLHPPGKLYGFNEYYPGKAENKGEWLNMEDIRASENYPEKIYPVGTPRLNLNGGVMLIDREHRHLFRLPAYPLPEHWCSEQNLLSVRLEEGEAKFGDLGILWNCPKVHPDFDTHIDDAFFLHINGCWESKERIELLRQYVKDKR